MPEAALAEGTQAVSAPLARAFALFALITAGPAAGLPGDSEQPITIRTDTAFRDETSGETVYRGNVEMTQGSLLLRADEVVLSEGGKTRTAPGNSDPLAATGILRIIARGNPAFMRQQLSTTGEPVQARARIIEYQQPRALLQLRTTTSLRQGAMKLRAERIDYLINRQLIRAFAGPGSTQRVVTSIPPERLEEQ
jgi:lipopolysaccharide export system protein LptA